MELRRVEVENYEELIGQCFAEDEELIEKWHITAGEELKACVKDTVKTLKEETQKSFRFFEVLNEGDERVGFFGTEHVHAMGFLTTFFVRPLFRNKEYILAYWRLIRDYFNDKEYRTAIWGKNQRAYDHLIRIGGKFETRYLHEERNSIVYIIKI